MKILLAILLSASAAFAQGRVAPAQGAPPKHLTKGADGHITANHDPDKADAFEVRVVKTGDTLSEISGEELKDSKLWPQLWEENEHIINPHWIYPNDKILIRPVVKITEAAPPSPPAAPPAPPTAAATDAARAEGDSWGPAATTAACAGRVCLADSPGVSGSQTIRPLLLGIRAHDGGVQGHPSHFTISQRRKC